MEFLPLCSQLVHLFAYFFTFYHSMHELNFGTFVLKSITTTGAYTKNKEHCLSALNVVSQFMYIYMEEMA